MPGSSSGSPFSSSAPTSTARISAQTPTTTGSTGRRPFPLPPAGGVGGVGSASGVYAGTDTDMTWVDSLSATATCATGVKAGVRGGGPGSLPSARRNAVTSSIDQRRAGSRVMAAVTNGVSQPPSTSRGGSSCTIR